ncbi:MAG: CopG family transcriptional regulator [Candidatus Micrarchaeota archaeon]|nr:CopG family transcriptional regulator [Candidatus Micrarchaeota archaeon]
MVRKRMQERRKYTTITIPSPLFDNIQKKIENTGFSSVSDYATFVLRETVADLVIERSGKKSRETSAIMDKLKALGYM